MIKHTPGPWNSKLVIAWQGPNYIKVVGSNGAEIAAIQPHPNGSGQRLNNDELEEIAKANERLIAAAPELLEACKEVLSYLPTHDGKLIDASDPCEKIQLQIANQLKKAIHKATEED